MKRRDETSSRHAASHYTEIELPGGHNGSHLFRVPSPLRGAKLIQLMVEANTSDEKTSDQIRAAAAVVGETWHHDQWDIDTERGADLLAFGDDVFEELHREGYRLEWVILIAHLIVQEIRELSKMSAEVRDRLGFSEAAKVNPESLNSSPAVTPTGISIA